MPLALVPMVSVRSSGLPKGKGGPGGRRGFLRHLKDRGHPLEPAGKLVTSKTVTDGPYAEKDLVGGFSLVEARDLAQAAELSRGCPILERGGAVEVRPIMKM